MNHADQPPTASPAVPSANGVAAPGASPPAPPAAPAAPKMTKDAVNAMLGAYVVLDQEVTAAEQALAQAQQRRSDLCQKLANEGPGKGRYKLPDGKVVALTSRKSKEKDANGVEKEGKETFFFRTERDTSILGGD